MLEAEAVQQKQLIFKAEGPHGIRWACTFFIPGVALRFWNNSLSRFKSKAQTMLEAEAVPAVLFMAGQHAGIGR